MSVLGLRWVELAVFLLLALVSVRRFLRHRERAVLWIAAPFAILAITVVFALTSPARPTGLVSLVIVQSLLSLLSLFPMCLYWFLACFERPSRPLRRFAWTLTPIALVFPWTFTGFPATGQPQPRSLKLYLVVFAVQWIGISLGVAGRLWRAGAELPTAPRRRARTLAAGVTAMAADLLLGVATPTEGGHRVVASSTIAIGIVGASLSLFGCAPPTWLVRIWRGEEDQALNVALVELVSAESAADVTAVLLPAIRQLVGASGAAHYSSSGELVAVAGAAPDVVAPPPVADPGGSGDARVPVGSGQQPFSAQVQQVEPGRFRVLLPSSYLEVWLSPYTPFFGRPEFSHLRSLGSLLELSLGRAQAREREANAAEALREAQEIAQVGSWSWTEGSLAQSWSEQMSRLFGIDPDEGGPTYQEAIDVVHPDDRAANAEHFARAVATRSGYARDYRIVRPSGEIRWVRSRCKAVVDAQTNRVTLSGTAQDITEDVLLRERLSELALTDALTGLPNRTLLTDRLTQALSSATRRSSSFVGVLFLDVDRFKVINDSLGHEAGDAVLLEVAARLTAVSRSGDTVARLGGDEFVIVCENLDDATEVQTLADRLHETLRDPLQVGTAGLVITVSCGIAVSNSATATASSLLREADEALYRAKASGRGRSVVFRDSMREQTLRRLETEIELRHALEGGQLRVFYQPQVDLASGRPLGVEALVRWQHPSRGLVPPDEFISIAEETGLILPLGGWVLCRALEQVKTWQRQLALPQLTVAVNLSALQLAQPHLSDTIGQALATTGVDPATLELEITETVLMHDAADIHAALQSLHALGARLSVDDFGTGYSSLAYLKRFPVDVLKIDRCFTAGVDSKADERAIVTAIIAMAAAMSLTTVAEGVETTAQQRQLQSLGCGRAQGFLFAAPAAADQTTVTLQRLADGALPRPRQPVPVTARTR